MILIYWRAPASGAAIQRTGLACLRDTVQWESPLSSCGCLCACFTRVPSLRARDARTTVSTPPSLLAQIQVLHSHRIDSIQTLQDGINDCIHQYNHQRAWLKLKGLSPVQYRTQSLIS
ncbi:IS3 family transposase [Sinorhizobium mexicanum]|uniref:IS3 family transposase n=1 Tax=Sinorhizobium mexicanum TaxID=375549 RepID=A0A859QUZ7_9HYPH|nr:IS3 family transposase [Sinorhizobium mexicanum]